MASFTEEEIHQHALDWAILRDGGIWLYSRPELLREDLDWLVARHYNVKEFDTSSWHSEVQMHDELSSVLGFPAHYGRNLDALSECMSEDLAVPDAGGVAVCFRHFDQFASRVTCAHAVLNILAGTSREHMLRGRRFLTLVQSDDPRVTFNGLGCTSAQWNRHEWLFSNRGM